MTEIKYLVKLGNYIELDKTVIKILKDVFMNLVDETERNVLLQDLKRLDAKKESLIKQLKETNQEIEKLEKKLKDLSRK